MRPLTRDDLACLTERRATPRVKGFRDTHHRLARYIAFGYRYDDIMRITGFSYVRITTLRGDPAFQELIAQYREKVTEAHIAELDEMQEESKSNMLRAERKIGERLDEDDEGTEKLSIRELLAITSDRADRFGYPKKKEINSNFTGDFALRIEKAMSRLGHSTVIDARPLPPNGPKSIAPEPSPELVQPAQKLLRF